MFGWFFDKATHLARIRPNQTGTALGSVPLRSPPVHLSESRIVHPTPGGATPGSLPGQPMPPLGRHRPICPNRAIRASKTRIGAVAFVPPPRTGQRRVRVSPYSGCTPAARRTRVKFATSSFTRFIT